MVVMLIVLSRLLGYSFLLSEQFLTFYQNVRKPRMTR
jgi:hypothetical protein